MIFLYFYFYFFFCNDRIPLYFFQTCFCILHMYVTKHDFVLKFWKWNRDFTFAARGGRRMYVLYVTFYSIISREKERERERGGPGLFFILLSFLSFFLSGKCQFPSQRPAGTPRTRAQGRGRGTPLPPPSYPLLQTPPPPLPPANCLWDRGDLRSRYLAPLRNRTPPPVKFFFGE